MSAVPFDTLKFAQALREKAKLSPEQAEGTAAALADAFADGVVTKADLRELRLHLEHRIESLEQRLTIKLGLMVVALGGFLAAMKVFE